MIKFRRIYPLKQNGRLGAVLTLVGSESNARANIKLKVKPNCDNMMLILFCPKTYNYIMEPFSNEIHIGADVSKYTGAILACKNGQFIEFIMEGSSNQEKCDTAKLKSRITMDLHSMMEYSSYSDAKKDVVEEVKEDSLEEFTEEREESSQPPCELMEYIEQMEKGDLYSVPDIKPCCEEKSQTLSTNSAINVDKELKEVEEGSGKYCQFINPFKDRWEGIWWQVQYPDKDWHYIVGRVVVDGNNVSVIGVPGDRYRRPATLQNCDMYAIGDNGIGYWLVFQK